MKARGLAILTIALGCAFAWFACDLDIPDVQNGAAVTTSTSSSGVAGSDGGGVDAAVPSLCDTQPDAAFCDDFNGADAGAQWNAREAKNGTLTFTTGAFVAQVTNEGRAYLREPFEYADRQTLAVNIRIDVLGVERSVTVLQIEVKKNNREGRFFLNALATKEGPLAIELRNTEQDERIPIGPLFAVGQWKRVSLALEQQGEDLKLTASMDDAPKSLTVPNLPRPSTSTSGVGPGSNGGSGTVGGSSGDIEIRVGIVDSTNAPSTVTFDDVLFIRANDR